MMLRATLVLLACSLPPAATPPRPVASAPAPRPAPADDEPVDLAAWLPDHAVALLGTRDWNEFSGDFEASALGRLVADEAFAPLRTALGEAWTALGDESRAELGFDPFSFTSMLSGQVAVALLDASGSPAYEAGDFPMVGALIVDVGDRADDMGALLDELLDTAAESGEVVLLNESLDGEVVTTMVLGSGDEAGDGFARVGLHGNVLLLVSGAQGLEDEFDGLWDALDGGARRVLADTAAWRAVPASWDGDGMLLWADTARMLATLRKADVEGEIFGSPDAQEAMGMIDALGFDRVGPLVQTVVMDAQSTRSNFVLPWDAESVLGRVAGAIMRPELPDLLDLASPKVFGVAAVHLDWTALFDEAVALAVDLGGVSMADVAASNAEVDATLGFSLRDDLLVNLDGRLGFFSVEVDPAEAFVLGGPTPVPMNFALLLGLSDGEAMRNLVDTAVDGSPMRAALTREEFQGFDVYRLPLGMPGLTLFYALTDDLLVASLAPSAVHDVLRRKLSGDLPSLGSDEKVAAALKRLPADASLMRLEKASTSFQGVFDQVAMVAQMGRADMPDAMIEPLLRAMADLGDLDPAVLEKYLDRPTLEAWRVGATGITGQVLGP